MGDFGFESAGLSSADIARIIILENNEYKITYYEIISGTSGSLTVPSQATINAGEFGDSGNAILSKIDGSNKPTFQTPTTSGGVMVTASLNVSTGAWVASGTYTDTFVALIYSIKIKAVYYSNLNYDRIIETATDSGDFLNKNNNLSDLVSSKVARVNLGLDKGTNGGNAAYSILSTDKTVYTGTAFTAARIWTLPNATSVNPFYEILVIDNLQTVTATNTLTVAVQSGQYLNGVLNGTEVIQNPGGWRRLVSDGINNWTFDAGIVRISKTQTLTNKRITQRVTSITSSATPTPNADTDDEYVITALAAAAAFVTPSGAPTEGQTLLIRIKDNGTARALSFDSGYRFSTDQPAPTTTVIGKTMYLGFVYNFTDSKWDCLGWINNI